jgi:hypothetical protein
VTSIGTKQDATDAQECFTNNEVEYSQEREDKNVVRVGSQKSKKKTKSMGNKGSGLFCFFFQTKKSLLLFLS